jgi:predicted anti-sigma-YlaC factor YlaD
MSRRDRIETGHLPAPLLQRYAASAAGTPGTPDNPDMPDGAWTVEAHLEACAACRQVLADVVERSSPQVTALLRRVEAQLTEDVRRSAPAPARRRGLAGRAVRWARSWAAPAMLPRIVMTVLVVAAAVMLDVVDEAVDGAVEGRFPSLVLLVAPVAPLVGVSAAWSRRLDPAYEVVAASARAGLDLVLRRAVAVLAVVIPALAAAGAMVGVSPARWLLPCLAFTGGALVLGEIVGLRQAARGLAVLWAAAVVGPSLWLDRAPAVLDTAVRPAWLAVLVLVAALLTLRRRAYTRPVTLH